MTDMEEPESGGEAEGDRALPQDAGSPFRDAELRPARKKVRKVAETRKELRDTGLNSRDTFAASISVWRGNMIPFSLLSLVVYLPVLGIGTWFFSERNTMQEARTFAFSIQWLGALLYQFITAAATWGVLDRLKGGRTRLAACFTQGFARVLPVFLVAVVAGLPYFALGLLNAALPIPAWVFLVLLLPAAYFFVMFSVAVAAAVIEEPGGGRLGAIRRSVVLTRGRRWMVFKCFLSSGVLVGFPVMMALFIGLTVLQGRVVFAEFGAFLAVTVLTCVFQGYMATLPALIYHRLRREKEGLDVASVASVFD